MTNPGPEPRSRFLVPSLLAVLVLLSFLPSLGNGFVNWDDPRNLTNNPEFRGLGLKQLRWMWSTFLMGHYQPLSWMTLGLDYAIWGMNPTGYHLTSLLFHTANTVLLYFAIVAILRVRWPDAAPWPALAGALLYGIHPLRVESVAWATERRDVVCGFFALWSLLAYLKHVEEERQGRRAWRWLVLSCVAFAASLLSKALCIVLPALLLVLDIVPLGRFVPGSRRRVLLEKVPYGLLAVGDAVVMMVAMRDLGAVQPLTGYDLPARVAQACYGLCFYLWKSLVPVGLVPLYRIDVPLNPLEARFIVSMLAVAALSALLWVYRRRWPAGLATWVCYVLLLLPVLGLVVTGSQLVADRYSYLALIPLSVLAAAGVQRLVAARPDASRLVRVAAGGLLLLLSVGTVNQTLVWRNSVSLWSHEVEWDPVCSLGYNNRADAKLALGDWRGVVDDCTLAIRYAGKGSANPYSSRGEARLQLGDVDGALRDFDVLVELKPKDPESYRKRGIVRLQKGNPEGSVADLTLALELGGPRAELLFARASARAQQRDWNAAAADFERALEAAPADSALRRAAQERLDRVRREARGN